MRLARPSLVEALFKVKREFKPWDRNPLGLATANQLNALRDYIEELENKDAELRGRSATDTGRGGSNLPGGPKNGRPMGKCKEDFEREDSGGAQALPPV